jgi:transposase
MRVMNKTYSEDYRADAVRLVERGDRSIRTVAEDLGINHWTLRDWVRKVEMAKSKKKSARAPVPPGTETPEQKLARLERDNARLLKENESLRMDREILKKAAAFFAKESG